MKNQAKRVKIQHRFTNIVQNYLVLWLAVYSHLNIYLPPFLILLFLEPYVIPGSLRYSWSPTLFLEQYVIPGVLRYS